MPTFLPSGTPDCEWPHPERLYTILNTTRGLLPPWQANPAEIMAGFCLDDAIAKPFRIWSITMPNYVYIATSLDGFIATPEGGLDWLMNWPNPTGDDYGYAQFMQSIDAIVMGRGTFATVLGFGEWPYAKPVFVLSRTLTEIPAHLGDRVELMSGDVSTRVNQLHQRGYHNLYIDGGQTIQSFLAADLIDELILTRVPMLLGQGIPLCGELELAVPQTFSHQTTQVYPSGLVKSHYQRSRAGTSYGSCHLE